MTLENVCIVNNNGTNDPNQHARRRYINNGVLLVLKSCFRRTDCMLNVFQRGLWRHPQTVTFLPLFCFLCPHVWLDLCEEWELVKKISWHSRLVTCFLLSRLHIIITVKATNSTKVICHFRGVDRSILRVCIVAACRTVTFLHLWEGVACRQRKWRSCVWIEEATGDHRGDPCTLTLYSNAINAAQHLGSQCTVEIQLVVSIIAESEAFCSGFYKTWRCLRWGHLTLTKGGSKSAKCGWIISQFTFGDIDLKGTKNKYQCYSVWWVKRAMVTFNCSL